MVRTIIFDLGGVIVPFDFRRGYARMEGLCPYPAAQIPARLRSTDLVTRFETGQIEPEAFVAELCAVLELNATYDEFCDLWTSIFLPETLIPEAFVESLKADYRLLLLSNTNAIHFQMIQRHYPLIRHFDQHVLSYKVGAMKPSPEIYQAALAQAGCRAEECFFTDDLLPYVEGARRMGIDAVQFQSFAQLREDLKLRGVCP
jgi:putative hydrolase of the HAD superfamily